MSIPSLSSDSCVYEDVNYGYFKPPTYDVLQKVCYFYVAIYYTFNICSRFNLICNWCTVLPPYLTKLRVVKLQYVKW